MAALLDYRDQVAFARRWIKEGRCKRIGTWSHGRAFGDLWHGSFGIWQIHFETVGQYMVPGSFRVSTKKGDQ